LVECLTFVSDRKLKEMLEKKKRTRLRNKCSDSKTNKNNSILYVEKLLTIPIRDDRKNVISLILAPYFVNILNLTEEESYHRLKRWVLKCNELKSLEPSINDFDFIIRYAVKRAKETGVKPLKFKDTLQYKNRELFRLLSS
jgi:hypothetical protein